MANVAILLWQMAIKNIVTTLSTLSFLLLILLSVFAHLFDKIAHNYYNIVRGIIMTITATELKVNLGKYLRIVDNEDIYIKKNGKVIAMFSNPNKNRFEILKSLEGIIPSNVNENDIKRERLIE